MPITDVMVVAAGTTDDPKLARLAPGANKALTPISKRPALSYLMDSLKECEAVSKIILIGDQPVHKAAPGVDVFIESSDVEADSIVKGIQAAETADRVLVLRGDTPLASSEALSDLLGCAPDADLVYPVVEETDMKSDFPEWSPFYLKTREGRFTGSSCILFKPRAALSNECLLQTLLEARKNPLALIGLVGPMFAMKAMASAIYLSDFESRLSEKCNLSCRVFVSHYPELFISVDSPRDPALIEQALTYI